MDRLYMKSKDMGQIVVEGLYKDLERRIVSSPVGQCPVDMAAAFLRMCHAQSCGKCVPCRVGLGQLQIMLEDILSVDSDLDISILKTLEKTAESINLSADCAIGIEAATMILKGLRGFRNDYESHILNHRCTDDVINQRQSIPCSGGCPASVDVPGYSALVLAERYDDAIRLIRKDNPFPSVCGLICEHPCETNCRRNIIDSPVNIRGIKRYAADNCSENVPVPKCMDKTGKKIAVIGGGPSGLTAAYFLSLMGHDVTIFDKRSQLGGMLRYGIPSYRLPRERLQWDIDAILSTGIKTEMDFDISAEGEFDRLKKEYNALYVSIGSHNHKSLNIPGEFAKGVIPAVEMLRGIGDDAIPEMSGKSVAVIGGGNVAMDVARTAMRLGASEVCIIYRRRKEDMTALAEEVNAAVAEGCQLIQLKAPKSIIVDKKGNVKGVYVQPQIIGEADKSGRPSPKDADLPEEKILCDLVISAIGQSSDLEFLEDAGMPIVRGTIKTQKNNVIDNVIGIYAGGDCVTGPSTVINAIAAGKVAAANIDSYLGYNHQITCDVEIPAPRVEDKLARGRIELKERYASQHWGDFSAVELPMTREEVSVECSRCLRCDTCGIGSFRGGREEKW